MNRQPAASRARVHTFERDHSVPTDYYGRDWCRWCHLPGRPNDERHPEGAAPMLPPTPAEARSVDLRRLGERDDDEEIEP